ncbi:DNA damage-regulated autophagy modulator protein 2 [Halyomorpha halys]|uniref:DNA damage-regulated autophagy modulator protein 2 n=1 Tax=Halyomorpha halys TaxID=286706 RepID=UPI0006D51A7B|nr:DNA damage-regulated autophagy modulator protein 2-like [Halyomorpha halys]
MGLSSTLARRNLHVIPTLVCLITPLTFVATYLLSVYYQHVYPVFPYISDTGAESPESSIFSQFINISALLLGGCVYIRGLQVAKFANFKFKIGPHLRLHCIATWIGYGSCLGLSMVANFQVNKLKSVHYMGACLCFLGGTVYFVLQTIFSYYMAQLYDGKTIFICRCILCSLSTVLLLAAISAGIAPGPDDSFHWTPRDPDYGWHLVSTSSEWLLALTQSLMVLTFLPEFKPITIQRPEVRIEGISPAAEVRVVTII